MGATAQRANVGLGANVGLRKWRGRMEAAAPPSRKTAVVGWFLCLCVMVQKVDGFGDQPTGEIVKCEYFVDKVLCNISGLDGPQVFHHPERCVCQRCLVSGRAQCLMRRRVLRILLPDSSSVGMSVFSCECLCACGVFLGPIISLCVSTEQRRERCPYNLAISQPHPLAVTLLVFSLVCHATSPIKSPPFFSPSKHAQTQTPFTVVWRRC
jgi:hypothetical protein